MFINRPLLTLLQRSRLQRSLFLPFRNVATTTTTIFDRSLTVDNRWLDLTAEFATPLPPAGCFRGETRESFPEWNNFGRAVIACTGSHLLHFQGVLFHVDEIMHAPHVHAKESDRPKDTFHTSEVPGLACSIHAVPSGCQRGYGEGSWDSPFGRVLQAPRRVPEAASAGLRAPAPPFNL
jgi:hypothetical protein